MGENYVFCCSSHINFNPSSHLKDFFSKCDQIRSFLQIWSHLLKKFLMGSFIFCAVWKALWQRCFWVMFQIVGHKVIKTEHSVTINSWRVVYYLWTYCVVRKMKFSIKIFLASANQIVDSGRFVPLLTKKNITENFFAALQSCVKHFFSNPNIAFPLYKKWCLPLRISSFFVQCPMPQKVLWYTLGCRHHTRFLVYFKL